MFCKLVSTKIVNTPQSNTLDYFIKRAFRFQTNNRHSSPPSSPWRWLSHNISQPPSIQLA